MDTDDPTDNHRCPVCLDQFDRHNRVPLLLTCAHTICAECSLALNRHEKITCPICRFPTKSSSQGSPLNLKTNYWILSVIEHNAAKPEREKNKRRGREHVIISQVKCCGCAEQYPENRLTTCFCMIEESNFYKNCLNRQKDKMICRTCADTHHHDHKKASFEYIRSIYDCLGGKLELDELNEDLLMKCHQVDNEVTAIKNVMKEMVKHIQNSVNEINIIPVSPNLARNIEEQTKRHKELNSEFVKFNRALLKRKDALTVSSLFYQFGPQNESRSGEGYHFFKSLNEPDLPCGDAFFLRKGFYNSFLLAFHVPIPVNKPQESREQWIKFSIGELMDDIEMAVDVYMGLKMKHFVVKRFCPTRNYLIIKSNTDMFYKITYRYIRDREDRETYNSMPVNVHIAVFPIPPSQAEFGRRISEISLKDLMFSENPFAAPHTRTTRPEFRGDEFDDFMIFLQNQNDNGRNIHNQVVDNADRENERIEQDRVRLFEHLAQFHRRFADLAFPELAFPRGDLMQQPPPMYFNAFSGIPPPPPVLRHPHPQAFPAAAQPVAQGLQNAVEMNFVGDVEPNNAENDRINIRPPLDVADILAEIAPGLQQLDLHPDPAEQPLHPPHAENDNLAPRAPADAQMQEVDEVGFEQYLVEHNYFFARALAEAPMQEEDPAENGEEQGGMELRPAEAQMQEVDEVAFEQYLADHDLLVPRAPAEALMQEEDAAEVGQVHAEHQEEQQVGMELRPADEVQMQEEEPTGVEQAENRGGEQGGVELRPAEAQVQEEDAAEVGQFHADHDFLVPRAPGEALMQEENLAGVEQAENRGIEQVGMELRPDDQAQMQEEEPTGVEQAEHQGGEQGGMDLRPAEAQVQEEDATEVGQVHADHDHLAPQAPAEILMQEEDSALVEHFPAEHQEEQQVGMELRPADEAQMQEDDAAEVGQVPASAQEDPVRVERAALMAEEAGLLREQNARDRVVRFNEHDQVRYFMPGDVVAPEAQVAEEAEEERAAEENDEAHVDAEVDVAQAAEVAPVVEGAPAPHPPLPVVRRRGRPRNSGVAHVVAEVDVAPVAEEEPAPPPPPGVRKRGRPSNDEPPRTRRRIRY